MEVLTAMFRSRGCLGLTRMEQLFCLLCFKLLAMYGGRGIEIDADAGAARTNFETIDCGFSVLKAGLKVSRLSSYGPSGIVIVAGKPVGGKSCSCVSESFVCVLLLSSVYF